MVRTFCDLIPADLQPGAKHDAKYDQLGVILFQKKCIVWFLVILCQLCVTLIHVSLMFASCFSHVLPPVVCCGCVAAAAKSLVLRNTCVCCLFDGGFQLLGTCHLMVERPCTVAQFPRISKIRCHLYTIYNLYNLLANH